ncbi:FAD:protein FMN transferase [Acidobacteria bacterium AH-259-L09]|nr:FAD:protein FMN transferase [Acidobacteria bacterium AH-259-L09]
MPKKVTSRRTFLQPKAWTSTLGASIAFAQPRQRPEKDQLIRAGRPAMACQFEIFFPASHRLKIGGVHRALDEVQRLERQMSVYRQDSEISALNRQAQDRPVEVEEGLFSLLRLGIDLYRETQGAFDMTASPLSRCWGFFARQGRVPEQVEIDRALHSVGSAFLDLDPARCSILFRCKDLELNLGSIGKGYALDRAATILKGAGLGQALLHAGYSSLLAIGNAPSSGDAGSGWQVSIRHPLEQNRDLALVRLHDQAMATSGTGQQYFISDSKRYGHIIDPRTGYPADLNVSATAFAKMAAQADALSTAFFVMRPEEIDNYCKRNPEVGALIVPKSADDAPLQYHSFGLVPEDLEVYL